MKMHQMRQTIAKPAKNSVAKNTENWLEVYQVWQMYCLSHYRSQGVSIKKRTY